MKDLIVFQDPAGTRLEAFHGAEATADPFKPGRCISGFRTGPLGMGHVVLHVESLEQMMPFYQQLLGFHLSDYFLRPYPAYFLHVNPRHHSLALAATGKNAPHHMMVELFSLDDVGQGYDLALGDEERIAVSLGRHAGDYVTSFYWWNPSGFMLEYGWGGQSIDHATWKPFERPYGPSLWGHDRKWLSPEQLAESRELRIRGAEIGLRQPVQVIEGNYTLNAGVCPWWDGMKQESPLPQERDGREWSGRLATMIRHVCPGVAAGWQGLACAVAALARNAQAMPSPAIRTSRCASSSPMAPAASRIPRCAFSRKSSMNASASSSSSRTAPARAASSPPRRARRPRPTATRCR